MSTENPLPPRATRTHPHLGMAHAYTPLAHLNKPAIFATPTRTTASPYQKLTNMSLLPRTGSSSSLHSLTRSPAFMKTRPSASPSPAPSPSPSPFPSPMLGSSLSSLTTSALINAHLSSSHSSLSLSTLSSLTHSPVQSATSSGTIINILSKLNSTDVDDCAFDEVDAHAYTEVSSHSSSSSSSNNSTNGECEDEDVSHMYDYGGDGNHTSGHMDSIDSSVLSVSTSSSMMSNNAASSLSYMSFGGSSHYAPQQQDMNDEYPEAAKDVPTQHHTSQSQHGSGSGTQSSTTTEDNLELESASALAAAQTTSSLSKTSSLMNLKQYNTRSRRASSDHIASPYLSPLLLAVMNNEHLSSLPALSFASPALSPSLGAFSQHGNGHRTTMATTQQQQPIHDHATCAAAASHVPLSPMSSATSGMTSMPALSPLVSPQTSPMLGSRGLGSMSLASLSTMQAPWPTASPSSSPAHSGANHSYMVSGFHPQQPHHYYQQQQLLHQHHFSHTLPHYPTHPQMHPMGSMHPYQPAYYGHPHMAHGAHPHPHTHPHASLHEQVSVKLEPRLPMMQDTAPEIPVPRTQPSVITAAAAAVRASMPPMEPSHGTKRKLDDTQEGEPRRVKKTIPKKSVKRRKKTGNESPSSDEQDEEVQATLSGDYKYQCTYESCGDCFKTRFSLKRHLKKHTGEKPYVCGIDGCDKTFAEKSTLKRHLRIHTGEKPYQCHVPGCGKLFADRTNVKRHEMIHTGERPYWCPFASCTRGYFWRKHLRKHVSSVHHANLSALSTYAKKNKQGEIIVGSGIVATAQTVPQSREAHGRVEEEDDILDDPDHEEPDEEDDEGMGGEAMAPSPRAKSKRVTTKKTRT